jgi:hypothetical protein
LFRASNTDPAEDLVINRPEWSVSTCYAAGLVSKALALHYGRRHRCLSTSALRQGTCG